MSTIYEYRWNIKNALLEKLYRKQLIHWNDRLRALSRKNARLHKRTTTTQVNYAIWYKNKEWRCQYLDWTDKDEKPYCLELHPDHPNMADEMAIIADELGEIEAERNKAERFLSHLVLFNAPPEIFQRVLGDTLYAACERQVVQFCTRYSKDVWDKNGDFSMNIFIQENQDIIKAMKQRLLVNLVTLQQE